MPQVTPLENKIENFVLWYLDKDFVGQVNNLHLALCDKYGQRGPFNESCQKLAIYCRASIDLAKHGKKYVDLDLLVPYYAELGTWPDFMEVENKPYYES